MSTDASIQRPAPAEDNDDVLLQAAQNGDSAALQALLMRLRPKLQRLVQSMLKSPTDAEEVVQEACLQLFRALPRYVPEGRGPKAARAWMLRIAVNLALMQLRRQRRAPTLSLGEHYEPAVDGQAFRAAAPSWAPLPETAVAWREQAAGYEKALAALPDKYRWVVLLADFEGHSNEEVADVLGLTLPTVKARLYRARLSLRGKPGR